MKKFHFRLQPVLSLRQREQQQKQRAVGLLLSEIYEHQHHALSLDQAIQQEGVSLRPAIQGRVDVNRVADYHRYVSVLRHQIQNDIQQVGQIQKTLSTARQELVEANRRSKTLEKLRDRQTERYQSNINKSLNNELDEISANAYQRRQKALCDFGSDREVSGNG